MPETPVKLSTGYIYLLLKFSVKLTIYFEQWRTILKPVVFFINACALTDSGADYYFYQKARFEKQMEKDREKHQVEMKSLHNQITTLTQTIQRNESVIIMLKQQLASKQKVEEVGNQYYSAWYLSLCQYNKLCYVM